MRRRWLYRAPGSAILEADGTFEAILIQEGRSQNGNDWSRAAIEDLAQLSDGATVSCYDFSPRGDASKLTHWEFLRRRLPPKIQQMLPERLAPAQTAKVREPIIEDGPDGLARLRCKLDVEEDRKPFFRELLESARRLGRDLGISIHVPEGGMKATLASRFVRKITGVTGLVGYDLVSQPSAGGRVLPVLEALATRRSKSMLDFLERLLRLVPEDKRPALEGACPKGIKTADELLVEEHEKFADDLLEALGLSEQDDDHLPAVLEALAKTAPEPQKRQRKLRRRTQAKGDDDDEEDDRNSAALEAIAKRQKEADEKVSKILLATGRSLIKSKVDGAKLPAKLGEFAVKQLGAVLESAGSITDEEIDAFVGDLKTGIGAQQNGGGSLLEGANTTHLPTFAQEWNTGQRAEAALEAMISGDRFGIIRDKAGKEVGRVRAFTGPREAWAVIMDDPMLQGLGAIQARKGRPSAVLEAIDWDDNQYMQRTLTLCAGRGALEAIATSGFTNLLANVMNKRLAREYALLGHRWRLVSTTTSVSDFKTRTIVRTGEYNQLPVVNEAAAYQPLTTFTEEAVTAAIAKRGGTDKITWEAILNDDLRGFRAIPRKLARAAEATLNTQVWGKLLNNVAWDSDSTAVFHANHSNIFAGAYSYAQLEAARQAMTRQKDMDLREAGRVRAKRVFTGTALHDTIYADLASDGKPNLTEIGEIGTASSGDRSLVMENPSKANALRTKYGWELHEVHEFDEVSGSENDVIVAADPMETEIIEVGFLNGREDPEIFLQDMQNVGSFFDSDEQTYKVRHVHDGGEIVDYRGLYLINDT